MVNVMDCRGDAPCEYCGRERARPGCVIVSEPTERGTYSERWRHLCERCYQTYRDVPYGFVLE